MSTPVELSAPPNARDGRRHVWWRWGLALAALLVYTLTCAPTVTWGDSGELIVVGATLSIPHPPGHPLYALLAHAFSWIPFGSVAWRVNWMSAVFGAAAVVLVFELVSDTLRRLGAPGRRADASAALAAGMFGLTQGLWASSTAAETTTLHAAFMAAVCWLVLRITWEQPQGRALTRALAVAGFAYGFSASNHVAGIFLFPAFATVLLLRCGRQVLHPRNMAVILGCGMVGLLPYLYLPLRSLQNPVIDWGNPETLSNFWWVVSAKQYQAMMAKADMGATAVSALLDRAQYIVGEWTIVGSLVLLGGFVRLARRASWAVVFVLVGVTPLLLLSLRHAFIIDYFVPALLLLALPFAAGVDEALRIARTVPRAVPAVAAALLLVWSGWEHYDAAARQGDRSAEEYGRALLGELPPDAILFSSNQYMLFIPWYLQYVEGYRTDVAVIDPTWPTSGTPLVETVAVQAPRVKTLPPAELRRYREAWHAQDSMDFRLAALLAANTGRYPLYVDAPQFTFQLADHLEPCGFVLRFHAPDGDYLTEATVGRAQAVWTAWADRMTAGQLPATSAMADLLSRDANNQGLLYESIHRDDLARWQYDMAIRLNPDQAPPYLNRGRLHARTNAWRSALVDFERAVALDPHNARTHYWLGVAQEVAGDLEGAYRSYLAALRWDPDDGDALRRAGLLMVRAKEYALAQEYLGRASALDPDNARTARGLVRLALGRGDFTAAADAMRRAQQLDSGSTDALLLVAEYAARTGQRETAAQALAEARAREPEAVARAVEHADWARGLTPPAPGA